MTNRGKTSWRSCVSICMAALLVTSTTYARSEGRKYQPVSKQTSSSSSQVQIVVKHAKRDQVDETIRRYKASTEATVVPVVVEAGSELDKTLRSSAMNNEERTRYAAREMASKHAQNFEGGSVVIAVSIGSVLLVALIVVLLVLLLD